MKDDVGWVQVIDVVSSVLAVIAGNVRHLNVYFRLS